MLRITIILLAGLVCLAARAEKHEPKEQVATFFAELEEKGPRPAVENLVKGTLLLRQKGMQFEMLYPQFEGVARLYGKVKEAELIDEKPLGRSFVRYRYITHHESGAPLFWVFMFYKTDLTWEIHSFLFNDQVGTVFKEL